MPLQFLWDHIESKLISKTKLPTSLKNKENAQITITEHRKAVVLAIRPENTKAGSVEMLTL
jgi:UDP-3-O-acyl-N-acetylglucosamine deacetylase